MLQHDHAARGGRTCWVCTQLRSTQRWVFLKGGAIHLQAGVSWPAGPVCINLNFWMYSCNDKQFPKTCVPSAGCSAACHQGALPGFEAVTEIIACKLVRDVWLLWWCCFYYMTSWPASLQPLERSCKGCRRRCVGRDGNVKEAAVRFRNNDGKTFQGHTDWPHEVSLPLETFSFQQKNLESWKTYQGLIAFWVNWWPW